MIRVALFLVILLASTFALGVVRAESTTELLDPEVLAGAIAAEHARAISSERVGPGVGSTETGTGSTGTGSSRPTPRSDGAYVGLRRDGALVAEAWRLPDAPGSTDSSLVLQAIAAARDDAAAEYATINALEVCLAYNFREADLRSLRNDEARRGVLGIELKVAGQVHRYAPTTMIARNLGFDDLLRGNPSTVRIFDATQFFVRLPQSPRGSTTASNEPFTIFPMFRGNKLVEMSELSEERICELARTMGDWLARQVHEDGRMTYKYWPSRRQESDSNNLIRQFMATQCLSRLVSESISIESSNPEDEHRLRSESAPSSSPRTIAAGCDLRDFPMALSLVDLAGSNLHYNVATFYREDVIQDDTLGFVVETDGEVKLGAIALAALAIHDSPMRAAFRHEEQALQRTLNTMWRPDGSFQTFYRPATRTDGENFYSGEALLYWAELLADEHASSDLLTRFMKSVRYYREWHLANRNPAFVPWHTQACFVVWQVTRDPWLVEWIFTMNDWLLGMQQWNEAPYADMRGRFYAPGRDFGPPHASSTGVYMEGLADAFALARAVDDSSRMNAYRDALLKGIRNVAQLQFADDVDLFYIQDRPAVQGGLRTTEYDNEIRVDNVQHVLMALLDVLTGFTSEDVTRPLPPVQSNSPD